MKAYRGRGRRNEYRINNDQVLIMDEVLEYLQEESAWDGFYDRIERFIKRASPVHAVSIKDWEAMAFEHEEGDRLGLYVQDWIAEVYAIRRGVDEIADDIDDRIIEFCTSFQGNLLEQPATSLLRHVLPGMLAQCTTVTVRELRR